MNRTIISIDFKSDFKKCFFLLFLTLFIHKISFSQNVNDGGITSEEGTVYFNNINDEVAGGIIKTYGFRANNTVSLDYGGVVAGSTETNHISNTIVSFYLPEEQKTNYLNENFTATLVLNIEYGNAAHTSLSSMQKTLVIDYKKDGGNKFNPRSYFVIPSADYVKVSIDPSFNIPSINKVSGGQLDLREILKLAIKREVIRYYSLNTSVSPTIFNLNDVATNDSYNAHIVWPNNQGVNICQLEWVAVENEILNSGYYNDINGNLDYNLLFRNNSSRVDLNLNDGSSSFKIPLLYDCSNDANGVHGGKIFARTRPCHFTTNGVRIDGNWTTPVDKVFTGHEPDLNWQVSTSFAEEGKFKTVISYFDGTLRNRQTVTRDNETDNVIASETFYDYQGRPTIQILPTPTISGAISYQQNLNLFNTQTSTQDPAEFFDLKPSSNSALLLTDPINPFSNSSGAANYYSSSNADKNNGENKYIPDAGGYPYTVTRYTPDATGRIYAQSGVGAAHALGTNAITKYYYGSATQYELDALFGIEVGDESHYTKNMVKDANGQYSVSYVDMHGRTIATALAGNYSTNGALANLKLDDYRSKHPTSQVTKNLLTKNTNLVKNNNTIESVTSILVTAPSLFNFKYRLDPSNLKFTFPDCNSSTICYDCLYDLEISIVDESGELTLVKNVGDPFQNSITYNYNNISLISTASCSSPVNSFPNSNLIDISVNLGVGSYSVRKTLKINEASIEVYLNELKKRQENCYTTIYNTILSQVKPNDCATATTLTCEKCNEGLGTNENDFIIKYLNNTGYSVSTAPLSLINQIKELYKTEKAKCDLLCNSNPSLDLVGIRDQMLEDMKPFSGQYAKGASNIVGSTMGQKFDIFSNVNQSLPLINIDNPYKHPKKVVLGTNPDFNNLTFSDDFYYDVLGNIDNTIDVTATDLNEDKYNQLYSPSWANSMLPYHPEYPKLLFAEQNLQTSYNWIGTFNNVSTYINPLGTSVTSALDPFYVFWNSNKVSGATVDYYAEMNTKINNSYISGQSLSMWQIAYGNLYCKTLDLQTNRDYCYQHAPANPTVLQNSPSTYSNSSNSSSNFNYTTLTDEQKNQVWEVFKGLYMAERSRQLNDYIANKVPLSDAQNLVNENYFLHFPKNDKQAVDQIDNQQGNSHWWPTSFGTPPVGSALTSNTPTATYESRCNSYVPMWKAQILQCSAIANHANKDAILNAITTGMVGVCIRGADAANPWGASNVDNFVYSSYAQQNFEAVFQSVFTQYNISTTDLCNPFVIEWPKKRGMNPAMTEEYVTQIDECLCKKFNDIKTAIGVHIANDYNTFNNYVQSVYNESITEELFNELKKANCGNLSTQVCQTVTWNSCGIEPMCAGSSSGSGVVAYTVAPPSGGGGGLDGGGGCTTLSKTCCTSYPFVVLPKPMLLPRFLKCSYAPECITIGNFSQLLNSFETSFVTTTPSIVNSPKTIFGKIDALTDEDLQSLNLLAKYVNYHTGLQFNWIDYVKASKDKSFNWVIDNTTNTTTLICRSTKPLNTGDGIFELEDPCKKYEIIAEIIAKDIYEKQLQQILKEWEAGFRAKCLSAANLEEFTATYTTSEYHYTLYYYDMAGNLVKTVPPQGAKPNYNAAFLTNVQNARNEYINGIKTFEQILADNNINDILPNHTLLTKYRYNSLNQVVEQSSPDVGVSHFWYDALGRLVVSQNAKQKANNKYSYTLYDDLGRIKEVGQLPQTYNIPNDGFTKNPVNLSNWITKQSPYNNSGTPEQVTVTMYDVEYYKAFSPSSPICPPPAQPNINCEYKQSNLRNRVSFTAVYNSLTMAGVPMPSDHSSATIYTYDIHGNVDVLWQDYGNSQNAATANVMNENGNSFKKITYEYDLISGKVNKVSYQPGKKDQYFHRYKYDAENRLIETETSFDQIYWERNAKYQYYKHGPLARTILGQQLVQGIDYAYTIQGWLKGVNSTAISSSTADDCAAGTGRTQMQISDRQQFGMPSNYIATQSIEFLEGFATADGDNFVAEITTGLTPCLPVSKPYVTGDMGDDGSNASTVARDAYGFSLNYFNNDYTPINTVNINPFVAIPTTLTPLADGVQTGASLYNGNISSMFVNIPKLGTANLYAYRYDQLNRIVAMNTYKGFNASNNNFGTNNSSLQATEDYKERVTYDANGNILTYLRNGAAGVKGLAMDNLNYQYYYKATNNTLKTYTPSNTDPTDLYEFTNQLAHVKDAASTSAYTEDLKNQGDKNYSYDEIGNLIKDTKEGISNIEWTVYGKIASITKTDGTVITYTYDASGNRISKTVAPPDGFQIQKIRTTWYVRDASGNVMSVYTSEIENGRTVDPTSITLTQAEIHLYGSSRLGLINANKDVKNLGNADISQVTNFTRGITFFELSNHLGNVLVTVTDRKIAVDDGVYEEECVLCPIGTDYCPPCTHYQTSTHPDGILDYYLPDIVSANDYYPFGMTMPGRKYDAGFGYRYGFNGKENDKDAGEGIQDYGMRIYDGRIAKFLSVDPLTNKYPMLTPYQFSANTPIWATDLDGAEANPQTGEIKANIIINTSDPSCANMTENQKANLQNLVVNALQNISGTFNNGSTVVNISSKINVSEDGKETNSKQRSANIPWTFKINIFCSSGTSDASYSDGVMNLYIGNASTPDVSSVLHEYFHLLGLADRYCFKNHCSNTMVVSQKGKTNVFVNYPGAIVIPVSISPNTDKEYYQNEKSNLMFDANNINTAKSITQFQWNTIFSGNKESDWGGNNVYFVSAWKNTYNPPLAIVNGKNVGTWVIDQWGNAVPQLLGPNQIFGAVNDISGKLIPLFGEGEDMSDARIYNIIDMNDGKNKNNWIYKNVRNNLIEKKNYQ